MACLLNIDLGELPAEPKELYRIAHLANVACGGHAGDEASMRAALEACSRSGARAGAHPSYPDRVGFGRRHMELAPALLQAEVRRQCGALAAVGRALGVPVGHLKPHGALYHAADREEGLAEAVVGGAVEALGRVAVLGPPGGALSRAAARAGLPFLREGFADRGLLPDGSLVPRGAPGALITGPAQAAAQARTLARSGGFDTLCVHGDGPGALEVARAVRAALDGLQ